MGFFSNITSSIVKTVLTPVAIVVDAGKVVVGIEADTTKDLIESAVEDAKNVEEFVQKRANYDKSKKEKFYIYKLVKV